MLGNGPAQSPSFPSVLLRAASPGVHRSTGMNSDAPFNAPAKDTSAVTLEPTVVRVELPLKSLLIVLALIAGLWMLLHLVPVLLVLVAALMIVGALHPPVVWLERR